MAYLCVCSLYAKWTDINNARGGENKRKYERKIKETHLFAGIEALRLCADFWSHVTRNVWPDNGENDDDEKEDDAGGA